MCNWFSSCAQGVGACRNIALTATLAFACPWFHFQSERLKLQASIRKANALATELANAHKEIKAAKAEAARAATMYGHHTFSHTPPPPPPQS